MRKFAGFALLFWLAYFVVFGAIILTLAGCTTAGTPPPCSACVGPYDLTLSSHREGLGL